MIPLKWPLRLKLFLGCLLSSRLLFGPTFPLMFPYLLPLSSTQVLFLELLQAGIPLLHEVKETMIIDSIDIYRDQIPKHFNKQRSELLF
mmetsp:Transcript_17951/g.22900  ORF Transcript_17951/g.22900 Transcript_17951/m.22900 type:complete len:89 (-) Transcript_17951:2104-2370(-)